MARRAVRYVVVNEAFWNRYDRSVARENEVRFQGFQPLKLLDVFVHLARMRWNQDGADAGQHVSRDQAGLAEKANMARVMAGRHDDTPRLCPQRQCLTVGEHAVNLNAFRRVFACPNRDIDHLLQEIHIGQMVVMAVRKNHRHRCSVVPLHGGFNRLFVLERADGGVNQHVVSLRVAHEVAIGVVCRW